MATQWFANPGQKLQTTIGAISAIIGALGLLLAVTSKRASLKAFDWSSLLVHLPWAVLLIGGASLIAARLISTRARADAEAAARLAAQAEAEKGAALARAATAPAKKVGEGQRKFVIPSIDFPTPYWLEPLTPVINKKK